MSTLQAAIGLKDVKIPPLSKTQAEILKVETDQIPQEMLFEPVPLVARLTKGVPEIATLAKRQRETITEEVAAGDLNNRPPEVRFNRVDSEGGLSLKFTEPLEIPSHV